MTLPLLLKGKTLTLSITYLYTILVVTCPPLINPSHGNWHRDDCKANRQSCRSVCLLRCDIVNGFQLEGPDRRECLANGQWSTPWNSHCKGMRRKDMDVYFREHFFINLVCRSAFINTSNEGLAALQKKKKKPKRNAVSHIPHRLTSSRYGGREVKILRRLNARGCVRLLKIPRA